LFLTTYLKQRIVERNYSILIAICCLGVSFFLFPVGSFSQNKDSTSSFKLSGYTDVYYAHYSDSVGINNYSKFAAISPRNDAFGLNVLQLTAQYSSSKLRATATMHYGDLPASAWSPQFNLIQEANIGFRLNKKMWIDAGLFKTHIGTESLLPKDNIASSLSIITVYEPWWQSGVKLSYAPNDKLFLCFHILNGYNTFVTINKTKSVGIAATYTFSDKASLGYYSLYGDETPDTINGTHLRLLNNLVFTYILTPKLKSVIGVDYISQENSGINDPNKTAYVYSAIVTLRYQLKPKLGVYGRFEAFSDANGMLTGIMLDAENNLTGYKLTDYTLGLEYKPTGNSYVRLESRSIVMDADQKIFHTDGSNTNVRWEMMINAGIWF